MARPDFDSATLAFMKWYTALPGATFCDSIEMADLRSQNAGRGIVATRDIPADTTLFTIPRKAILSIETTALRSHMPHIFEDLGNAEKEQALDSWSALILTLMYEHFLGGASPWKSYMDVLPESFDTPMFWSSQELQMLQGSSMISKIGKDEAEGMFRAKLLPAIRSRPDVFTSSSEYSDEQLIQLAHRMGSTIMAYAFDLENEDENDDNEDGWVEDRDGKSLMGMVPMADMLNADAEFNAHVNHGDDSLTVTSLRPIKAGEEILNYYGPHPNSELLRRYGYVTEKHSRYDVVEIPWSLVEEAIITRLGVSEFTLKQARERIESEDFEDTFVLERESGEPAPDGTLPDRAGFAEMPDDLQDQLKLLLKTLEKVDSTLAKDKKSRQQAQGLVLAHCIQTIELRFLTGVSEDLSLLKQENLPYRQRMAIKVRLGEKKLLEEAKATLSVAFEDVMDQDAGPRKKARHAV
ncbi:hypothetical protein HIM_06617 [Hirsutella minnesotensis 3608]|uniref:SET domain-containing protein n=1 Tax=Hirsutella minnesotensis 3608 TaxID=1043627 RepID=A0A0F8A4P7_9HYPO|nr:hypothetical protein HIM_06617 [Hirsutella minnesotensis 3608]